MQNKSKEWVNRFRKLEYFDIGDLFFFTILVGYFQAYFTIAKIRIFIDILSRFSFQVIRIRLVYRFLSFPSLCLII